MSMPSPVERGQRKPGWAERGSAAVDHGDLETARACFAEAVRKERGNAGHRYHLALVEEALGHVDAAAAGLTQALRLDPGMVDAARRLSGAGKRSLDSGDLHAAANLYRRAAALLSRDEPDRVAILPDLSESLTMLGDFEGARAVGGTIYPIGSTPLTKQDWVRHYGPLYPVLALAKTLFDPNKILAPGPGIF